MNTQIGSVYANALFALAEEQGDMVLRSLRADLRQCAVLFTLHPDYGYLLTLPALSIADRIALAEKAFGTEGLLPRLLRMLIERNRVAYLREIADAFDARMLAYENIVSVTVTTAVPLSPAQLERLTEKLSQKLQKRVRMQEHIDRSVLGGIIVQYGDTRMDNSLKLRLEALRTRLQR